jgi:NADP-dependent 3-hydroxy acid dehydrogenase YdfG
MTHLMLTGAVALVSGASGLIGAATARRLAREGAAVGLVASQVEHLGPVTDDIVSAGGTALAIEADLTDPDGAAEAVQVILDRFGRLDVLVNGVGIMILGTALHSTVEEWRRMVALNVGALLHVTHAAVPYLIDAAATSPRGVADIVNLSSTAGRVPRPASSVYTLTRSGLNGFTESLRQELVVERVRVSVVSAGTVAAELVDQLRPEDVADAVAYVVTRDRRMAVNELVVRAGDQTW